MSRRMMKKEAVRAMYANTTERGAVVHAKKRHAVALRMGLDCV